LNRQQRGQQHKEIITMSDEILNHPVEVIAFKASTPQRERDHIMILLRMKTNLQETDHPMHHKTEDGTIVDLDVTLEHWMKQLKPLPSVPVNREHYGFDLYNK